jgi:excinuclease UvrABC nuclease subunit
LIAGKIDIEMKTAAQNLGFERAAVIRDGIVLLRKLQMG